jgi:hypothetical protein
MKQRVRVIVRLLDTYKHKHNIGMHLINEIIDFNLHAFNQTHMYVCILDSLLLQRNIIANQEQELENLSYLL